MLKFVLAAVIAAHGVGHLLFLGPALRVVDWAGQTSHSWLLSGALGDSPTRAIAALVWGASIVLFSVGVAGFLANQEWWRGVTIAAAIVSLAGIVAFWDGIATSNAFFAFVADVLVLGALLLARWPSTELAGS